MCVLGSGLPALRSRLRNLGSKNVRRRQNSWLVGIRCVPSPTPLSSSSASYFNESLQMFTFDHHSKSYTFLRIPRIIVPYFSA